MPKRNRVYRTQFRNHRLWSVFGKIQWLANSMFSTIQHPLGPELVSEHGKTFGPGSFLRRLYGFAFFAQGGKQFICLLYRFTLYANKIVVAGVEGHSRHIV